MKTKKIKSLDYNSISPDVKSEKVQIKKSISLLTT